MPLVPGVSEALRGASGVGGASEWQIGGVGGADQAAPAGKSFGSVLGDQLQSLDKLQNDAASASQSLADGTATDPTSVVMAVERARLSMQMAAQLRTKGVEAINDIFHTTV
ncbi:MAG: fliE [Solirubrobacterales bacterium]|nr:fliE [Solirubrobacterales bacterium]